MEDKDAAPQGGSSGKKRSEWENTTVMTWQQNDAHTPPDQTLEFLSVPLRLSSLVELLVMERDNTLIQNMRCARWYRERALQEHYPGKKYPLTREKRRAIAQRAIEMAIEDAKSGRQLP
jgi:hypothetical protein